jgi:hypothetical protein
LDKIFICIGNKLLSEEEPTICNNGLVELHGSLAKIFPFAIFNGIELYNGIMSFEEIVIGYGKIIIGCTLSTMFSLVVLFLLVTFMLGISVSLVSGVTIVVLLGIRKLKVLSNGWDALFPSLIV